MEKNRKQSTFSIDKHGRICPKPETTLPEVDEYLEQIGRGRRANSLSFERLAPDTDRLMNQMLRNMSGISSELQGTLPMKIESNSSAIERTRLDYDGRSDIRRP